MQAVQAAETCSGGGPGRSTCPCILGGCGELPPGWAQPRCMAQVPFPPLPPLPGTALAAGTPAADPLGRLAGGQMAPRRPRHEGRVKPTGSWPGCWHGQRQRCTADPVLPRCKQGPRRCHIPPAFPFPSGGPSPCILLQRCQGFKARRGVRGREGGTGSAAGFCQQRVQHAAAGLEMEAGAQGWPPKTPVKLPTTTTRQRRGQGSRVAGSGCSVL